MTFLIMNNVLFGKSSDKGNCVNCHAYCERDPSRMMFHARADLAGTLILQDGLVEKLDVQTEQMGSFVYPYWHPSGDYIAFP